MKAEPFIIEKTYNARIERVWEAITDLKQMKQWYFPSLTEFKPEVGFKFSFDSPGNGRVYTHVCTVVEVIPGKKLIHSWSYKDTPGKSFVTWELFDEDGKTRLKLTHTGLETFPQDTTDYARSNFVAGWTHITGISLVNYLEKE